MSVLKNEIWRFPARRKFDCTCNMPVVVAGKRNHFAMFAQATEERLGGDGGGLVVDQVAHDKQLAWLIFRQQFHQPTPPPKLMPQSGISRPAARWLNS